MFPEKLTQTAGKLVEYCNSGQEKKGLDELYVSDAVSVEAADMMGQGRETQGIEAIKGKHDWWEGAHDIHESTADGPFFYGEDQFGVIFQMDVTNKESGERQKGRELGIYTVNGDGKIVKEEFFYAM